MTELARYTVEKFCSLDVDGEPCFLQVGGLEVATTPERLAELHRRHGWVTAWGVEARLLDRRRVRGAAPAAWTASGARRPATSRPTAWPRRCCAVEAQLRAGHGPRRALPRPPRGPRHPHRADGRVDRRRHRPGRDPRRHRRVLRRDLGPEGRPHGRAWTCPLTPLAHQLAWTGPVPALAGQTEEAVRPILRHQDADLYYRDRFDRLGIGYYGHRPMPIVGGRHPLRGRGRGRCRRSCRSPRRTSSRRLDGDARRLLPATQDAKVEEGINGLFSFTTDNMPLLGESPDVKGFWVAEAVWVTHSAGVGRAMAEWLVDGYCSSFDLHECDVNRFEPHQLAPEYVLARDCQNFVEVYDILHPLAADGRPAPAPHQPRSTPASEELGAFFLEANGWERPQWYEANAALVERPRHPDPRTTGRRSTGRRSSAPRRRRPARRVAMYDMTALKRLEVTGPGAADFLQRLYHRQRRQVGRLGDLQPAARRRRRHPQRHHRRPAGPRPLPGRRQRQPRPRLVRPATCPRDGIGPGPRHHPRHLLHRPVGPAGPRRSSSR